MKSRNWDIHTRHSFLWKVFFPSKFIFEKRMRNETTPYLIYLHTLTLHEDDWKLNCILHYRYSLLLSLYTWDTRAQTNNFQQSDFMERQTIDTKLSYNERTIDGKCCKVDTQPDTNPSKSGHSRHIACVFKSSEKMAFVISSRNDSEVRSWNDNNQFLFIGSAYVLLYP